MTEKSPAIKTREKKIGPATRDAFGQTLVELGHKNPNIVVLDGDLSKSTRTVAFGKAFPDRFFNCGIQEANMVSIASGLASCGKIPFLSSFACFLVCKGFDQLRMGAAFSKLNLKVVTSHGGISVGEDGVSQQSIEDIALMLTLPHFKVMVPSDAESAKALVSQAADYNGPVYIRCGRPKMPVIYEPGTDIQMGKANVLRKGSDVTLVACGILVFESLLAADQLSTKGIEATVVDMHTLKPLDGALLKSLAQETGAMVTCEEHSIYGGLNAVVAQALAQTSPIPLEAVAIQDCYAESGAPDELLLKYGLTAPQVTNAAERAVQRK